MEIGEEHVEILEAGFPELAVVFEPLVGGGQRFGHEAAGAALGVAAHEAGHAIQDKVGYGMMAVRQSLVPAVQVASPIAMILGGFAIYLVGGAMGGLLLKIAIGALAVITVFQFVTLPVEFDATARAKRQLVNLGIVHQDEMAGVHETLDAARDWGADLIVMGSHGRQGVKALILGSVAQKVLTHAHVPVLIVKG